MRGLVYLSLMFNLVACGGSSDDTAQNTGASGSFQDQSYFLLDAGDLERSESSLKGSGLVAFSSALGEQKSKDNFLINFSLDDGGSLSLLTHSDNQLQKGIDVVLSRSAGALKVSLAKESAASEAKILEGIDATQDISLAIDVHNDEVPAHILIWPGAASSFEEGDAVFNSEDDAAAPGNGVATAWGLRLDKAHVSGLQRGSARFSED